MLISRSTATRYLAEQLGGADGVSGNGRDSRSQLLAEVDNAGSEADQDGVIAYGAPYLWAHLEALRALQRGGYIDQWQLGSAEARLGGEPGE
jgi:hypothetical protein